MTTLVINYDSLTRVANNASNLSSRAETYANDLTTKVYNKFSDISGGSSTYTADAKYYVKAKINALEAKKDSYATLSTQINTFVETAKRVDEQVESAIAINQETFLSNNEHLRIDDWKASILNWLTDLKNSCPLFEVIGNALQEIGTAVSDMLSNIKYWYKCEGGKEKIAFALAICGAVAALLAFIATFPISTFVAVCSAIGAFITLLNSVTNICTSYASLTAAQNNDPAWAKIYGNQDTLSDVLRQTNFNNGLVNRLSYGIATTIDTVNLFCDAVNVVDTVSHLKSKFGFIQNYFSKDKGGLLTYFKEAKYVEALDYDELGNICGTKWIMATNSEGVVETRFTAKSVWRGIKAFVMDQPISCDSDLGIRTTLNQNFKIDFSDWRKSFTIQGLKDTFVYNVTDGGRITYSDWKNSFTLTGVKDTIRYNLKNNRIKGLASDHSWNNIKDVMKGTSKKLKNISTFVNKMEDVIDGSYDFKGDITYTIYNFSDYSELLDKVGVTKIIGNKLGWKNTKDGVIQKYQKISTNTYSYKKELYGFE